ncbi:unnamed protein product [Durusdinium trenchii]|uniref:Protein kinase domain-containing protein n=1 Tax=Durusdinium trenchii TaxID=1381693 RepID=A0ABP0MZI6_9DINO
MTSELLDSVDLEDWDPAIRQELAALRGRLVALQRRQQAKELIFQESQQQLQHEIHAAREGNQTLVQQLLQLQAAGARGPATELAEALAQEASAAAEAAAYAAELLAQGRAVEQLREELDQSAVGARARGVPRGPQAVEGFARQQVALEEQRLRRGIAQARQELDAARAQSDAKAFRNELLEEEVEALRTTREAQGKINAMSKSSSSAAMGAWQRASLALSEAELQQQLLSFEALGHAARSIRDSADSGASSISRRDDWSPERCLWASPKARGTAPLELSLSSSSQLQTSWTLEQRKSGSQDLDVALSMLIPKEADRNAHDNDPREGTGGSTWAMLAELASGSTHEKTIWEEVAQADAEVQCDDVYLLDMASWEAVKEEICQLERARNEQLMQELKEERERAASKHVESLAVEQGLRQELRAQEELLSESRTEEKRAASKQVETLTLQRELKEEQRAFAHQREKLLHEESLAKEEKRAASKQAETLTLQRELKEEQRAFAHQREKLLHAESLAKEEKRAAQKTPVEEHVARLTDELLDEQRAFAQQWETWLAKEESLERRAASSMESVARLTSHALKEEQRGFASQREKLLHEESLAKEEKAELDLCRAAATKREELFRNELSAAQTQTAAERARAASAAAARHRVEEAQRLRTLGTPARAPSPAPSPARSPPIEPIAVREMALARQATELKRSLSQQLPDKKPQPLPRRAHRSVGVPNGAIGLHRFGFDALRAEIAHAAAQHRSVLRRAATATAKPSPSRRLPRQLSVRPESSRVIPRAVYADRTVESGCRQSAQSPCRLGGWGANGVGSLYFSVLATCSGWLHYAQVLEGVMAQRTPMAQRQSVEGVETSVSQSPISEPISEISDRKSLDALDALDGNIWKDFDSFNISNFSALEVERFEFHHVLRASDGVRAQIEVHSDLVEGTKVVVKRFPRAYLKDSPAEFRQSNHTLEDPWKEMFLALKLGAPGSASQISGVLPCHGIFIHPSGDVMLFMEYATSGDLFDFATALGEPGPAREAVATQLLRPLVHVVLQLHQMGIAHGDISAENAILCEADGEVSVALLDFAMAVDTSKPRRFSAHGEARGKPMYRPPEEWSVDVQGADLFACGVLGYALAIGNYPWQSTSGACKAFDYVKKKGLAQFFRKRMIPMGSGKVPVAEVLSPGFQEVLIALIES